MKVNQFLDLISSDKYDIRVCGTSSLVKPSHYESMLTRKNTTEYNSIATVEVLNKINKRNYFN